MELIKGTADTLENELQVELNIGSTAISMIDLTLLWFPAGLQGLICVLSESSKQY
jgi:hypothetical protein